MKIQTANDFRSMSTQGLLLAAAGAQVTELHYRMHLVRGDCEELRAAYNDARRVLDELTPAPVAPRVWPVVEPLDRWEAWDQCWADMNATGAHCAGLSESDPAQTAAKVAHDSARAAVYCFGVIERRVLLGWSIEVRSTDADPMIASRYSVTHTCREAPDSPQGGLHLLTRVRAPDYAASLERWIRDPSGGFPK